MSVPRASALRPPARAAALLGVALACAAVGAASASGTSSPPGWNVRVLPVAQGQPASFSEPGIAAGPRGVMLANACTANSGAPSTFWRSADYGRTWSRGFPIGSSAIGCGDSDAAIGADGYSYSLTLGTGVNVYRSRDSKHWDGPASFPPPHGIDQPDRPWLVLVPGRPRDVLMFNSEVGGNIVAWRSHDHARTFTGPTPVTGGLNSEAGIALGSRPLVDPAHPSHLRLFYETAGAAALPQTVPDHAPSQFPLTQLWEASSTDGGRSWTNTLVLDVTKAFGAGVGSLGHLLPAPAVDRAGNFYVVLSVRLGSATDTHLFLIHSQGHGWSRPAPVDGPAGTASNVFPAVAVTRPGRLFVSWYASRSRDFNDPAARWAEYVAATRDALSAHPHFHALRLSGSAPVHVGAVDNMGAIGFDLGQDWALRDFQSVTVDPCGHPHVTWASDYRGTRAYTATTTPFCRPDR
ncbi:MAG TPA: sialidase family protein [Jatrophihabitantaceae bacterium]|nr:sialidase family protein [Jatrophihabitantaceae bacterium]